MQSSPSIEYTCLLIAKSVHDLFHVAFFLSPSLLHSPLPTCFSSCPHASSAVSLRHIRKTHCGTHAWCLLSNKNVCLCRHIARLFLSQFSKRHFPFPFRKLLSWCRRHQCCKRLQSAASRTPTVYWWDEIAKFIYSARDDWRYLWLYPWN